MSNHERKRHASGRVGSGRASCFTQTSPLLFYADRASFLFYADRASFLFYADRASFLFYADRASFLFYADRASFLFYADRASFLCYAAPPPASTGAPSPTYPPLAPSRMAFTLTLTASAKAAAEPARSDRSWAPLESGARVRSPPENPT